MKFNINNKVRVKLTARGHELIAKNHKDMFRDNSPPPRPKEKNGWSEWQLWELMREFGPYLYNGCEVPFDTEINILENQEA